MHDNWTNFHNVCWLHNHEIGLKIVKLLEEDSVKGFVIDHHIDRHTSKWPNTVYDTAEEAMREAHKVYLEIQISEKQQNTLQ